MRARRESASPRKDPSWPPRATPASPPTAPLGTTSSTAPRRISFAKIREPLEVPNLLALQTDSFDWLLGNEQWQARVEAGPAERARRRPSASPASRRSSRRSARSRTSRGRCRCRSATTGSSRPKYSVEECKERDITYSAPLFVTAEFMNNETGEIKSQTVFMGDFPLMTDKGTFVINGTERVVVSQLVRSPGVYFDKTVDKTSDKDVFGAKIIPSRGAWLEFEIDKQDMVGVRVDRKRKQSVTVLLKALGWDDAQDPRGVRRVRVDPRDPREGPHHRPGRGAARHLPQAAPGRAAHARGRADAARQPLLQPEALRPGQGRPLQGQQEARARPAARARAC